MQKSKVLIRLLTLIVYFLPFVFLQISCDENFTVKYIYSYEQAILNDKTEKVLFGNDTTTKIDTVKTTLIEDSITIKNSFSKELDTNILVNNFSDYAEDFIFFILCPTKNSVSAIGCIYFYDAFSFGSLFISGSLLLLLLNLFVWKWIQKKKYLQLNLDIINLTCLIAFIIQSFIFKIDLLFGFWIIFIFQCIYIFFGFQETKKQKKFN